MPRTIFQQGFRAASENLGHGPAMGDFWSDAQDWWKRQWGRATEIRQETRPAPAPTSAAPVARPLPEPTVLGLPRDVAVGGGILLAGGIVVALVLRG